MALVAIDTSAPPTSLLDLLANGVVFDSLIRYLPLQSLLRLSSVARSYHHFIFSTPNVFRSLDLSRCRGAYVPPSVTRIDSGGHTWRAERLDENLTEDEFLSGPLRGVLSQLQRKQLLRDVRVLILDELASVTHDVVWNITTSDQYQVRLLSVRKCINLNAAKLQQLLTYLCRPGRSTGSPQLQGLYYFTDPATDQSRIKRSPIDGGVTGSDGATLGVLPVDKSRGHFASADAWYAPTGRMFDLGSKQRTTWEETLQACQGIIAFDTVLCTHMHAAMSECLHDASRDFLAGAKPGIPPLATVSLGPEGCASCGRAPDGAPVWGQSDLFEFPLLSPPPMSGRLIDAVRPPPRTTSHRPHPQARDPQRLVVSCPWCLTNRHCQSCHRWWCADCYNPKRSQKLADVDRGADSVKVFNGLCVEHCLVGEMMSGAGSNGMWA